MPLFLPPQLFSTQTVFQESEVSIESYIFQYIELPAGLNNTPLFSEGGVISSFVLPYNGSILAVTLDSTTPITQGSITLRPTLNGVLLPSSLLDAKLDIANPSHDKKTTSAGNFNFVTLNLLGIVATSSNDLLPTNATIIANVFVKLLT